MQPNKNSHIRKMYWFVAKKDMSLCLAFDSLSKGEKKKKTNSMWYRIDNKGLQPR